MVLCGPEDDGARGDTMLFSLMRIFIPQCAYSRVYRSALSPVGDVLTTAFFTLGAFREDEI